MVAAQVNVNLDAAGSYLMVDGTEIGTSRVSQAPYNYSLDTTLLANGQHTLQIWGHDTSNSVDLSAALTVSVANSSAPPASNPPPSTTTLASQLLPNRIDFSCEWPGEYLEQWLCRQ